jgi:hypothetical protein
MMTRKITKNNPLLLSALGWLMWYTILPVLGCSCGSVGPSVDELAIWDATLHEKVDWLVDYKWTAWFTVWLVECLIAQLQSPSLINLWLPFRTAIVEDCISNWPLNSFAGLRPYGPDAAFDVHNTVNMCRLIFLAANQCFFFKVYSFCVGWPKTGAHFGYHIGPNSWRPNCNNTVQHTSGGWLCCPSLECVIYHLVYLI